jgi:uncharacterized protein YjbI with pentapeptide repeats
MKKYSRLAKPLVKRLWALFNAYKGLLADIILVGVLLSLLWMGYDRFVRGLGWAAWTGLNGKTFLDWFELLIVPLALAGGALWWEWRQRTMEQAFEKDRLEKDREIARERREQDLKIAEEKRYDATLEAYLDRMTALLLKEGLGSSETSERVMRIARTRTLAVLARLDGSRKRQVIQFLKEANLIRSGSPYINLMGADLQETDFRNADLRETHLQKTNLNGADLRDATLWKANLQEASLLAVKMDRVYMQKTDLRQAILNDLDLSGADLRESDLRWAKLNGAKLRGCKLKGADLREAILVGADYEEGDLEDVDLRGASF